MPRQDDQKTKDGTLPPAKRSGALHHVLRQALEYLLAAGVDAGHSAVVVELWAGRPPRAVAKGAGPGRKEATQRAALAALRQEGFVVATDLAPGGGAAAAAAAAAGAGALGGAAAADGGAAKRKADAAAMFAAAAKRAVLGDQL
jgi:hypothetical protein